MSEQRLQIFVVDDDPSARMLTRHHLEDAGVEISEFADGDSFLAAAGAVPDIVVLDIEMPGTDGIAVCRSLRDAGRTDVEVIFVSARDDLEARLAAHDAGGNDYIVKPYAVDELLGKIGAAKRAIQARREVAEHVGIARRSAVTNLVALGEMGILRTFLLEAGACLKVDELGIALCNAVKAYGLHGLVDLHDERESHCYSSEGRLTALETSILNHVSGLDRAFQFHDRVAIQYPHTTLLLLDLPMADHERATRLRDHLAVLVGGAEARFSTLLCEARRLFQERSVEDAASELACALDETTASAPTEEVVGRLRMAMVGALSRLRNPAEVLA